MIEQKDSIDADVQAALEQGLLEHNIPFAGPSDLKRLQLVIRDDEGQMIAGLTGESLNHMFKVKLLWVHADHRRKGLATQLLEAAEIEARRRGDTGMLVSTYTYQGPELYLKYGFEIFGSVADYPPGYQCDCMVKRF